MSDKITDTIIGIGTSLSNNAISIIRLSGPESITIVNSIFKGKDLTKALSHTITYGHIYDPETNDVIDEVLVSIFKSPKSYTTEDVVEINCHGGIYVTSTVYDLLLKQGARIAEPGEFTKRAFLNGRIDLTKAEAVMDMIESDNQKSLKLANSHLRGDIYEMVNSLRLKIFNIIGKINVNIDYPEYDDVEVLTNEDILPKLILLKDEMYDILNRSRSSKIITSGINTAIVGKPNVGKSSLLNLLLNESKAIVTNIPGTTRDVVEGKIKIGGISLNLIDTAGIRETSDIIEKIGVDKSLQMINNADLILFVIDSSRELDNEDFKLIELVKDKKVIYILNKNDLETKADLSKFTNGVSINTYDRMVITKLEKVITDYLKIEDININDGTVLSNARQIDKLNNAFNSICSAIDEIKDGAFIDFVEMPLNQAWVFLGEITGEVSNENLLDELFSHFCLGK